MTTLRRRRLEDLQRRGLAPKTQPGDVAAVHQLAQHYRRPPDQRSEEELRQSCLVWRNETQVAESTFRLQLSGLTFFSEMTRQRPWPVLALVRPRKRQQLPVVLSQAAVRRLLAVVANLKARMGRRLIYACGLRLTEGTPRQVPAIEAPRLLGRVRQGNGGEDRVVPLAPRVLALWRQYWRRQRPRSWVCPARHGAMPLPPTSLHKTFNAVVRPSGLAKEASVHTRRHSYATQLVARGGARRVIQARLGHKRPRTTARDTHLPPPTLDVVHATSNSRRADRCAFRSRGMPEMADVFRRDGRAYWDRCGLDRLPRPRHALADSLRCRTEALGGQLWPCEHGGQEHSVCHAWRQRRCPQCHHLETEAWLEERRPERLPVPDVHVGFTVPQERGAILRRPQQDLDDLVLRAAAHALMTLAMDPHDVGGLLGVLGVLPTWARTLASQPPVPCLGPAGGLSADRTAWHPARPSSLGPVHALAKLFRGRFRDLVGRERPDLTAPEALWPKGWGGSCKPAVQGTEPGLQDLGRDVPRIALTNSRRLSIEEGPVCVRSQDTQALRWKPMTLPAQECIRRFLPQGLPQGFHKVRDYGLWRPGPRPLRHHRQRWRAGHAFAPPAAPPAPAHPSTDAWGPLLRAGPPCPACGQGLLL